MDTNKPWPVECPIQRQGDFQPTVVCCTVDHDVAEMTEELKRRWERYEVVVERLVDVLKFADYCANEKHVDPGFFRVGIEGARNLLMLIGRIEKPTGGADDGTK